MNGIQAFRFLATRFGVEFSFKRYKLASKGPNGRTQTLCLADY